MAKSKPTIRIISGTHRGRRLPVLDIEGLRPTGDRVREVLFNWLQFEIAGRNVLDLFAGTGALGFEAASRGAKSVTLIDVSSHVFQQLKSNANEFEFKNIQVCHQSADDFLTLSADKFDLIFLDPPFADNCLNDLNDNLNHLLNKNGFVYRESQRDQELKKLPDNFELYRHKCMGQVKIELWQKLSD